MKIKKQLGELARNLRNTYLVRSILRDEEPRHISEVKSRIIKRNYNVFVTVSGLVVLITVLFIISDTTNGFYQQNYPYSILNIASEICHLSVAVVLLAAILDKREKTDRTRHCYTSIYLLLCAVGCSGYSLSDAMRGVVSSGPYFAVMILVITPVLFEKEFCIFYGIYILPTVVYYVIRGSADTFNLTMVLVGYILHLYMLSAFVRELLLNIKYEESHAELMKMNHTDFLTKIGNRQLLYENIEKNRVRWIAEKKEIGLIMMDIDHFKCYNDSYSHLKGDKCLVSVSGAVTQVLGGFELAEITFIRFGGEEFLVMLVGDNLERMLFGIYAGIRRSMEKLALPSGKGAAYPCVTLSAGAVLTSYTEDLVIEELMLQADNQLYQVKEHGRNGFGFRGQLFRDDAGQNGF